MASVTPRVAEGTDTAAPAVCPGCNASHQHGRFCRNCGAALPGPTTSRAVSEPAPAIAPPMGSTQSRQPITDTPPTPVHGPLSQQPPSWPPAQWQPVQVHARRWRHSTGFAVTVATAILLALLAVAATVILLVANGGPSQTDIINQPTVTSPAGEATR